MSGITNYTFSIILRFKTSHRLLIVLEGTKSKYTSFILYAGLWSFGCSTRCWKLPYISPWIEHLCCTNGKQLSFCVLFLCHLVESKMPRIDIVYADFAPCINLLGLLPIGIRNQHKLFGWSFSISLVIQNFGSLEIFSYSSYINHA